MERTISRLTVATTSPTFEQQLESCFETFETYRTEFENAACRGAFNLRKDWTLFVTKDEKESKLLIDSLAGNLAALCFPLVQYPDEMESFAYVLEYCLRQNSVPKEAHRDMNIAVAALARGEYCGQDTGRITHSRGLIRIQLIIADKAMLTRPMHNRGTTFLHKDQTHALANLSPGFPVRPDKILRNVLRLFRVNLTMPNSQAYQEAWDLVVQSLTLTADALVANSQASKNAQSHTANMPFFKKIKQKLLVRLAENKGSAAAISTELEETNAKFIIAKTKLQAANTSIPRAPSLVSQWEALLKGHCIWGLQSDLYKAWKSQPDDTLTFGLSRGLSRRERGKSLLPSLHSPNLSLSVNSEAKSLRRVTGEGRKSLDAEF